MRKLKRTIVNGARSDLKKLAKKELPSIIKFNLGEDRDKEIDRRKDNELAKTIYLKWKQQFINTQVHPDDIVQKLNELAAELEQKLSTKETAQWIIENLIYPAMEKVHVISEAINSKTVKVQALCDGCNSLCAAEIPLKAWLNKSQFHLACDCGKPVPGTSCYQVKGKKKK